MGNVRYTENDYEQALIELFQRLGYDYEYGPDIERDYREPVNREELHKCLRWVNGLSPLAEYPRETYEEIIGEAVRLVTHIDEGSLEQRNERFMDYLQNGVEVTFQYEGQPRTELVRLIDFRWPERSFFKVVNQYAVEERGKIRCDMVVMVNALPLVVIELKSPSRDETDEEDAFQQIKMYQQKCPSLFVYNAFSVISDMTTTRAGTITAPVNRFMEWKSKNGDYESTAVADYETFFEGIFPTERLTDILENFICFDHKDGRAAKVMCAYHQFFAVNKAIRSVQKAHEEYSSKGGVFWHTQGSGKSFSMVFLVHKLMAYVPSLTVVVVTDRNDLDQQLYEQFSGCSRFLRQRAQQVGYELNAQGKKTSAEGGGRQDLVNKLKDLATGGIIFTTIQKFVEDTGLLSERNNIIVISDEAHRSQYGDEEWDDKSGRMKRGFAKLMRDALPNAIFVGFTGTPISERDRDTQEVFGDYIDVYDMTQAVADGATVPIYYESRVINLKLDEDALGEVDEAFDMLAEEGASEMQIDKARREHSGMKGLLCSDASIRSLCDDILQHYENNRQYEVTGKAMIVAYNKEAAVKINRRLLELRPEWEEKIHVIASPDMEYNQLITERNNKEYAKLFKDDNSPMKIAIVVDMWLTGFDVPSLATMYIYKPMKGHSLMQAIARVNRVYPGKVAGLIVDYVGIAQALKQAMQDYTKRDRLRFGDTDIRNTALVKFREKLEICRDLFYGFDYSDFFEGSNLMKGQVIKAGVNFLLDPRREGKLKDFVRESQLLHNAETLCRSLLQLREKQEAAYLDAVRVTVCRFREKGKVSKREINERIANLLAQSIQGSGVINLFEGLEFSLFDEQFREEVRKMKEKNLAVQLLESLLKERLRSFQRTNVVKSQKFSELMNQALSNYLKGMLTNEEVLEELLKLAEEIKRSEEEGQKLGLTKEEMAFYDALSSPEGIKEAYSNEQFMALTKALTEKLRENRTIDWNKKESARASMRRIIKRLLREYHYPPEGYEVAVETVMKQCEKWADDEENLN